MKKQKPQKVECKLHTRSFAQLDNEIGDILRADFQDKDISQFLNDGKDFAGWSPEHTINGESYEQLLARKKKLEDENS